MLTRLGLALAGTLAEVIGLRDVTSGASANEQGGHLTLTYVTGIALLIGLLMIGFKKSKRTHLD